MYWTELCHFHRFNPSVSPWLALGRVTLDSCAAASEQPTFFSPDLCIFNKLRGASEDLCQQRVLLKEVH